MDSIKASQIIFSSLLLQCFLSYTILLFYTTFQSNFPILFSKNYSGFFLNFIRLKFLGKYFQQVRAADLSLYVAGL